MRANDLATLYDYNYWATQRILDMAARLTPEQFEAPLRYSWGGVRGTLAHTLGAEIVWRARCQTGKNPTVLPGEADFPTLDALVTRWQDEEAAMRAFIAGLAENDLDATIRYTSTRGEPREAVLWQILSHVVNHGTQHRSEVAVMLTDYGHSPGDIDLIRYVTRQQT